MSIFRRISDIISANLNDMVEGYEDPEKMLRQAIREMETAIDNAKPDVAKAMANEKTTAKELATNERECEAWASRAAKAVEQGDDDLARKALSRKREYDKIAAALRDQHAATADAVQTLRRQLEAMQAKLKDAQRRLGTLVARKRAADVRAKMAKSEAGISTEIDQDAFRKFDRLERKVEMAEAEASAMSELAQCSRELEAKDDDSPSRAAEDLEIEAELEELKKKKKDGA
jgi:phage shock protein A